MSQPTCRPGKSPKEVAAEYAEWSKKHEEPWSLWRCGRDRGARWREEDWITWRRSWTPEERAWWGQWSDEDWDGWEARWEAWGRDWVRKANARLEEKEKKTQAWEQENQKKRKLDEEARERDRELRREMRADPGSAP
jgi:hypothetical protein